MKRQFARMFMKVGFLSVMVFAAVSASAQSLANSIRVNIPFDFLLADQTLSAGDYSIGRALVDETILRLRSADGRSSLIRITHGVQTLSPRNKPTLVFHRYGDQYFLSQVWQAGAQSGRVFVESRSEREARKRASTDKMSAKPAVIETVIVTGR